MNETEVTMDTITINGVTYIISKGTEQQIIDARVDVTTLDIPPLSNVIVLPSRDMFPNDAA
jgi:hypothetical protein